MYGKTMDVWALGCTFYKMIYGVTPFSAELRPAELTSLPAVTQRWSRTTVTLGNACAMCSKCLWGFG